MSLILSTYMVGLKFSETHIITVTISLLTLAFSLPLGNKSSDSEETHLGKRWGCEIGPNIKHLMLQAGIEMHLLSVGYHMFF